MGPHVPLLRENLDDSTKDAISRQLSDSKEALKWSAQVGYFSPGLDIRRHDAALVVPLALTSGSI